jgi:hypothetical protein
MTNAAVKPFVLHVDDDPDELRSWRDEVRGQGRVDLDVFHPDDVTEDALRRASLVLVDFKLERWPLRANAGSLALRPPNGLALLSVLQEAAYELDKDSPRAFALFTAVINDVARGLVAQPYIVARAHNLEWVFDKTTTDNVPRGHRVAELAESVLSLPKPWPGDSLDHASTALKQWLSIPAATWQDAAWGQVERCRPPMHEFAEHTHGIGILRWALHRIWPYPTFLIDDAHLAARLRVDLASLRAQLGTNGQLQQLLAPVRYAGPLAAFLGRRWWRAGVESIVFSLASKDPSNLRVLHERLTHVAPELRVIDGAMAFPVIDERFRVKDQLATAAEVVEVVPDDWPPFADSAWALRDDARSNAHLMAITVDGDVGEG